MWGQEKGLQSRWCQQRIIPTRVGTSCIYIAKTHYRQDHPHACGDKTSAVPSGTLLLGSSPRVWGQVFPQDYCKFDTGIIPTRVGTRKRDTYTVLDVWDHPHACGDKYKVAIRCIVN